jgi:hypothetical protein
LLIRFEVGKLALFNLFKIHGFCFQNRHTFEKPVKIYN